MSTIALRHVIYNASKMIIESLKTIAAQAALPSMPHVLLHLLHSCLIF